MTQEKNSTAVLNEVLQQLKQLDSINKGVKELKEGQNKINDELKLVQNDVACVKNDMLGVKADISKVQSDVGNIQFKNTQLEERIKKLEESREGTASGSWGPDRHQWNEAIEYARRVVVFTPVENVPEGKLERARYMHDIFRCMGMDDHDIERYRGMRVNQNENAKSKKRVNVEFESYVHASQVLRMKAWNSDDKRVQTKIMIPEACHDRFVFLDNLGWKIRQINGEFRYDVRYVGENMVLFIKPGKNTAFHPVTAEDATEPEDAIKEAEERESKKTRRGARRGGKPARSVPEKRPAEVTGSYETLGCSGADNFSTNFRTPRVLRKPRASATSDRNLQKLRKQVIEIPDSNQLLKTDDSSESSDSMYVTSIYQCDGVTSPADSPNKPESPESIVTAGEEVFLPGFHESLKGYKLNIRNLVVKAREKFQKNEPFTYVYGDPEPEGASSLGSVRCRSVFIEMNPVYYHEVKTVLIEKFRLHSCWEIGAEKAEVVFMKPKIDRDGLCESHQIELKWTSRRKAKIVMFIYHTTHNMRIQGKKADLWWTDVLRPIYEQIISNKAEELRVLKDLAQKNPEQAANAMLGIKLVQTKLTPSGISYSSPSLSSSPSRLNSPTQRKICQVCGKGNIKKLTVCKSCNSVAGHASCFKNQLCKECIETPRGVDPEQLANAMSVFARVGRNVRSLEQSIISTEGEITPPRLTPPGPTLIPTPTPTPALSEQPSPTQAPSEQPSPENRQTGLRAIMMEAEDIVTIEDDQEEEMRKASRTIAVRTNARNQSRPKKKRDIQVMAEDMRVEALTTELAIVEEARDYWKTIALNLQEATDRRNSMRSTDDNPQVTVHNTMSLKMESKEIKMEEVKKKSFVVTRRGEVVSPQKQREDEKNGDDDTEGGGEINEEAVDPEDESPKPTESNRARHDRTGVSEKVITPEL